MDYKLGNELVPFTSNNYRFRCRDEPFVKLNDGCCYRRKFYVWGFRFVAKLRGIEVNKFWLLVTLGAVMGPPPGVVDVANGQTADEPGLWSNRFYVWADD